MQIDLEQEKYVSSLNKLLINRKNATESLFSETSELLYQLTPKLFSLDNSQRGTVYAAFDFLMEDNVFFKFQRKILSEYSLGNTRVLSNVATFFNEKLITSLKGLEAPPEKGIMILLLIIRKSMPSSPLKHRIKSWHQQRIIDFSSEESLLLYNTMFNQKQFSDNVYELQEILPSLDWVKQWQTHGVKKLNLYLNFWKKDYSTTYLEKLLRYLNNSGAESNIKTIKEKDFFFLLEKTIKGSCSSSTSVENDCDLNTNLNRIKSIFSNYVVSHIIPPKKTFKAAILISGQLRGYEKTITNWHKHLLPGLDSDIYIHTWNNVGLSGTGNFRRNLPFDGSNFTEAYRNACGQLGGHSNFMQRYPHFYQATITNGHVNEEYLSEIYKTDNIVIEDDNSQEFENWSNSRKMYYKIWKAQQLLDQSGRDYDLVIRIRPDKNIRAFIGKWADIYKKTKNSKLLLADDRYGIHYGNLMMGDQFAVGSQEIMQKYCSTYAEAIKLEEEKLFLVNNLEGHTSLARNCLLNGINVKKVPFLFGGLIPAKNLSSQQILKLIQEDALNRNDELDLFLIKSIKKDLSKYSFNTQK